MESGGKEGLECKLRGGDTLLQIAYSLLKPSQRETNRQLPSLMSFVSTLRDPTVI